jgi:Glycosyl hydrolases family 18
MRSAVALTLIALIATASWGQMSVHQQQLLQLQSEPQVISEDTLEARALEAQGLLFPPIVPGTNAASPLIDDDQFIMFGYITNYDIAYHLRWNALTHVGSRQVIFNSSGNFTNLTSAWDNRSSYLRGGGAAEAAGVKVVMVLTCFDDDPGGALETVMTTPALRTTLINNVVNEITTDSYAQGVSLDLEFSWGISVRDGITAFIQDLRTALPSQYELSVYTHPTYSGTLWDIPGIEPHIDYMLYSTYDYASGSQAHAIADFNNFDNQVDNYLSAGLPPEKLVLTLPAWSRRWTGTTTYNGTGTSNNDQGFDDSLYDTTLEDDWGGPYASTYVTGDEVEWYTYNNGSDRTVTWDSPESLEYKIRAALSWTDIGGSFNGRRLGGVGWWTLNWMTDLDSYDPITATGVTHTRTYPHIYQLCQQILSTPGTQWYLIEGFEGLDYRWRDPDESPDNLNASSSRALTTSPAGSGRPASTTNAMDVDFTFTASGRVFFRHEVLNHNSDTDITDINATAAHFDSSTQISAHIHTLASHTGRTVRMVVMDADGELEASDTYTLAATGWRELVWDLTDPSEINAYSTSEPAFSSGDGTLESAGGGAEDISFIGFLIEGGAAGSGLVTFDEIAYAHSNPGGNDYVINEFRYDDPSTDDEEFVEIYGPAGAFPAGMQLRAFDPSDGSVLATWSLSGTVPNDGGGFGHWVIGDSGVPNVDSTTGFNTADDLLNTDPGALQIYNTSTGCVYDSVIYEAFGGVDDLIRRETLGVTDEGWPWIGRIGYGTDSGGAPYTMARYPDGNDTDFNSADFSSMAATPGAANGDAFTIPTNFDFSTAPPGAIQTFQAFAVGASGVGASPNGGNVHRCVDTSGGGVVSFIGDASLGSAGAGYNVEGEIYIPSAAEPDQAVAIGFCGSQGTTFFSTSTDANAYEDGYWLIYENVGGLGLADGRPDHAGVFEFVMASHDNMDGDPVDLLGSAAAGAVGITPGNWTTFRLSINPGGSAGLQLLAQINGTDVFLGDIPAGGPTSGAVTVGFREFDSTVNSNEGTWIDNLTIDNNVIPVELSVFRDE